MATEHTIAGLIRGQRVPMSYDEYLAIADEDLFAEWVDGELIVFDSVSQRHQELLGWLLQVVGLFVDLFDSGILLMAPFEMRARPDGPARIPDLLFVAQEHRKRIEAMRLNGPADLVVELVAPESVRRDRVEKLREYAAAGVPEYWVLDTRPSPAPPCSISSPLRANMSRSCPMLRGVSTRLCCHSWLDPAWLIRTRCPGAPPGPGYCFSSARHIFGVRSQPSKRVICTRGLAVVAEGAWS
ncbi:MAG: Uma2 family endonuclease [Chloroflexia bacterium]